ncbi:hypothetical protein BD309DRAFT_985242 [Dichomitus squalens]|nr:hypothetical protein BD309DRAFT_985242 [Dichomitus squalens]
MSGSSPPDFAIPWSFLANLYAKSYKSQTHRTCIVIQHVHNNAEYLDSIRYGVFAEHCELLEHMFREHLSDYEVKDLWSDFHTFCTEYRHLVPPALREALNAFYSALTAADQEAWLKEHCIIIEVQKCQKPYPPLQHWVVESDEIAELWHAHCVDGKLHDKRGKHYPLFRVDETELVIARADQSVLFINKDSRELVTFVIRNWCPEAGIVDSVNAVVHNAAAYKKNVRVHYMLAKLSMLYLLINSVINSGL